MPIRKRAITKKKVGDYNNFEALRSRYMDANNVYGWAPAPSEFLVALVGFIDDGTAVLSLGFCNKYLVALSTAYNIRYNTTPEYAKMYVKVVTAMLAACKEINMLEKILACVYKMSLTIFLHACGLNGIKFNKEDSIKIFKKITSIGSNNYYDYGGDSSDCYEFDDSEVFALDNSEKLNKNDKKTGKVDEDSEEESDQDSNSDSEEVEKKPIIKKIGLIL